MSLIKSLREPKIADMAIFDLAATAAVAYYVSENHTKGEHPFLHVFLALMLLAIVVHVMIGTPTMLNAYLGLNTKEEVYKNRN